MRKITKTGLKRQLDQLTSKIVRLKNKCERCGKTNTLQCCHINSRKYNLTRWDLDNLLCLCASCHAHFHDHPLELESFVIKIKGETIAQNLKEVYKTTYKPTIEDLETKLEILKEIYHDKTIGEELRKARDNMIWRAER